MASEKVSRKMVLEIKYVNANNAVIHTENLVTGILAKISLGTGIWAKFRLGTGIWYPLHDPPIQDYVHPDDHTQPIYESTPGFKPFTLCQTVILSF